MATAIRDQHRDRQCDSDDDDSCDHAPAQSLWDAEESNFAPGIFQGSRIEGVEG